VPKIDPGAPDPSTVWLVPTLPEWLKDADKEPRWVVPGLIPYNDVTVCSGQKKLAGKSKFMMALSISMALGRKFGVWGASAPQRVFYALQEAGAGQTADRWVSICRGLDVVPEELQGIFFAHRHGIKLDDKDWEKKMLTKFKELACDVLVFDPVGYMYNGDENNTRDMQKVGDMVDKLIAIKTTPIILHHLGKDADAKTDFDKHVRGSGVVVDRAGAHVALRRYDDRQPLTDLFVRFKDGQQKEYSIRWEHENDEETFKAIRATMYVEDRMEAQKVQYKRCRDALEVDKKYSLARLVEVWGMPQKKAKMMLEDLQDRNILTKKDGYYLLTTSIKQAAPAVPASV
jgi:RecA-family ATPase